MSTAQENQAQIARDASAATCWTDDMAELVLEFVTESGLLTAADLRAALNDALATAACETAAGNAVAASTR